MVVSHHMGREEPNLGLQEQQVILSTEPSLQPHDEGFLGTSGLSDKGLAPV